VRQRLAWEIKWYKEKRAIEVEQRAERKKMEDEELEITEKEVAFTEAKINKLKADNELRRKYEDTQLKLKMN